MKQKVCPVRNRRFSNGAWVISVNMGYGHQRAVFPLKDLAPGGKIICANDYQGIPEKDRKVWEGTKGFYEFISKFKKVPLLGQFVFFIFNQFQKIFSFYPKRDLSKPNFQLKQIYSLIKNGWGEHLIRQLCSRKDSKLLPLITTFFTVAFMAEFFKYPGEIFCLVCDTDISRAWAPLDPKKSKIKYLAPTQRAVERLKLYGVRPKNIFLTGFPLPSENLETLKRDLSSRILNLDTKGKYFEKYKSLVKKYLGELPKEPNHALTIMFAVGGAGAQKEIGVRIVKSLAEKIKSGRVKVILAAGVRKEVRDYFKRNTKGLSVDPHHQNFGVGVDVLFGKDFEDYYKKFNSALKTTDILWTKPSELSFYTALGLPVVVAPPLGSQEKFNREWLFQLGSAINQKNPDYADQWLFDLLDSGWFAEAALQGFVEAEKFGVLNIKKIIS
ncbi:MAG: hypothetical protein ABIG08_02985 [bacterium]